MLCNAQITAQGNDLPWAVLIHGLFGSGDNLNILARALASHCNVIQIDLPDHHLGLTVLVLLIIVQ